MNTPKFKLEIELSNASFLHPETEISILLEDIATKVKRGQNSGNIKDTNGNTVGEFKTVNITSEYFETGIGGNRQGDYIETETNMTFKQVDKEYHEQ